jgi:hypothetical protein
VSPSASANRFWRNFAIVSALSLLVVVVGNALVSDGSDLTSPLIGAIAFGPVLVLFVARVVLEFKDRSKGTLAADPSSAPGPDSEESGS